LEGFRRVEAPGRPGEGWQTARDAPKERHELGLVFIVAVKDVLELVGKVSGAEIRNRDRPKSVGFGSERNATPSSFQLVGHHSVLIVIFNEHLEA
jgi:hypothetical protein